MQLQQTFPHPQKPELSLAWAGRLWNAWSLFWRATSKCRARELTWRVTSLARLQHNCCGSGAEAIKSALIAALDGDMVAGVPVNTLTSDAARFAAYQTLAAKVTSEMGADYIVQSFMTFVGGGVGNVWGTLAGASLIGFLQKGIEWFNPSNTLAAQTYMILFIFTFIQFRPKGIVALKGRSMASE